MRVVRHDERCSGLIKGPIDAHWGILYGKQVAPHDWSFGVKVSGGTFRYVYVWGLSWYIAIGKVLSYDNGLKEWTYKT